MTTTETPGYSDEHVHISLVSLGGLNYKREIRRSANGNSVYIKDPHGSEGHMKEFRIDAARFDAGDFQCRDGWAFRKWTGRSEEIAKAESHWQT